MGKLDTVESHVDRCMCSKKSKSERIKTLHISRQAVHIPLFWHCLSRHAGIIAKQTQRHWRWIWFYNTVCFLFHQCDKLHFHHYTSEHRINCNHSFVCTLPSLHWSKDRISAHMHTYARGKNNKRKSFVRLPDHTVLSSTCRLLLNEKWMRCAILSACMLCFPLCPSSSLPPKRVLRPDKGWGWIVSSHVNPAVMATTL